MLAAVVGRFSALAAVRWLFVLAGVVQGIVEVRTFAQLLDTAFGRAVLIKVVLVAGIAGLGYGNRHRLVARAAAAAEAATPGRAGVLLRRTLRVELALGVGALGATGALSGYAPSVEAASGPYRRRRGAGPIAARGRRSTPRGSAPTRCTSTCSTARPARRSRGPRS